MADKTDDEDIDKTRKALQEIAEGSSMAKAIKNAGLSQYKFHKVVSTVPMLSNEYSQVRNIAAHQFADEIIEIADTDPDSTRARNRIDARKWVASKLMPQQYGDRLDVNFTASVDIGAALTDARKRTIEVKSEVVETIEDTTQRATDCKSVDDIEDLLK